MKKLHLLLFALFVFSSCMNKDEHNLTNLQKDTTRKSVQKNQADTGNLNSPGEFQGIYTLNSNENLFRDCSNPNVKYWVIDETGNLKNMYDKFHSSKNYYSSVVAKVKGEIVPTEKDKYRERYPNTLKVKEVIEMQKKNFRNTCLSYDFWALGNEPNWSLQISQSENLIELIDYGENKTYNFFYEEPKSENGKIHYAAHNNINRISIDIQIKKELCSDTMSDEEYEYSVEVKLSNNKILKGCGIKGK